MGINIKLGCCAAIRPAALAMLLLPAALSPALAIMNGIGQDIFPVSAVFNSSASVMGGQGLLVKYGVKAASFTLAGGVSALNGAFDVVGVSTITISSITTTGAGVVFSTNVYFSNGFVDMSGNPLKGLAAPLTGDAVATKDYVDAALDKCALGSASTGDILLGKTADINCDNIAEAGTMAPGGIAGSAVVGDIFNGKTADIDANGVLETGTLDLAGNVSTFDGTANKIPDLYDGAGDGTNRWVMKETGDAAAGDILNPKKAWVDGVEVSGTMPTQILSDANDTVNAGYYAGTTLSAMDADLAVGNIKSGVTIFGKAGTFAGGAVPDTGQTTSYDVGDDADYNPAGTQPSYTVNADNTVTDNRTGLMWRRCSQGKNDDATCTGSALAYGWTNALAQCEAETEDYSDWRLPNSKELYSLVKYEGTAPFMDQAIFPATVSSYYWTGTTYAASTTYAMVVYLDVGSVIIDNKASTYYVRCVRAGP